MEKSYIQKITPFIDNMRVQSEGGDEPTPSYPEGTPFSTGVKYDYIFYNDSLSVDYINNILVNNIIYDKVEDEDNPDAVRFADLFLSRDSYDPEIEESVFVAGKIQKSVFTGNEEDIGYIYIITGGYDPGAALDGWVYNNEAIDLDGTHVSAGWHTEVSGQIALHESDSPFSTINQWDTVKTIFSSTPF